MSYEGDIECWRCGGIYRHEEHNMNECIEYLAKKLKELEQRIGKQERKSGKIGID